MLRFALAALFAFTLTSPVLAQESGMPTTPTVTIESEELGQTREIVIYEPMNYHQKADEYYDVIYVFDAHDRPLFDYVTAVSNLIKGGPRAVIVVGIRATLDYENMYFRNNDLLPSDTGWKLPGKGGNAEAFLRYVKNEVVPYVESNYRTLPHRTAIGHSLSASFLVYTLLNDAQLFDNYIAVSPNLAYDDRRLVKGLRIFDSEQFETPTFFYMSHANEGEDWPEWAEANQIAYPLLRDTLANHDFRVWIEEYPDENHGSGYLTSVMSAMRMYVDSIRPQQLGELSEATYEITIKVEVPEEHDEIYISGNQESLGDWAENQVKMERASPLTRQITVDVRDHVEVKFFREEGGAQAWVKTGPMSKSTWSRMIRPEEGGEYSFEIASYMN